MVSNPEVLLRGQADGPALRRDPEQRRPAGRACARDRGGGLWLAWLLRNWRARCPATASAQPSPDLRRSFSPPAV